MLSFSVLYAEENKIAPNFELLGDDGALHSLAEAKGKYVVLEWYNPGCPFVRKHYHSQNMQNLQKRFTEKGVIWYSIISSAEGKQGFLNNMELKLEKKKQGSSPTYILKDEDGKIGKLYGAKATPYMVVINPKGEMLYEGAIDDKASPDEEDLKLAKNYVSDVLDRALRGEKVKYIRTQAYGCGIKYKN